ncbi:MAG: HD domain-containing protein [Acidilobaceae archaeon]
MPIVGPHLIEEYSRRDPVVAKTWRVIVDDIEIQELIRMSNVNAVLRMLYNDHGPVHVAIVSGVSLLMFDLLTNEGLTPSSLAQGVVKSVEHSKAILLLGAALHDIGNAIHRHGHEELGALLAYDITKRVVSTVFPNEDPRLYYRMASEVANIVYSSAPGVSALTVESSIVKIADGTDMAEGRARVPYSRGKTDMHALSALSIKRVEVNRGERPIHIKVYMDSSAGFFQIEHVLLPKIRGTILQSYVEITPILIEDGKLRTLSRLYP